MAEAHVRKQAGGTRAHRKVGVVSLLEAVKDFGVGAKAVADGLRHLRRHLCRIGRVTERVPHLNAGRSAALLLEASGPVCDTTARNNSGDDLHAGACRTCRVALAAESLDGAVPGTTPLASRREGSCGCPPVAAALLPISLPLSKCCWGRHRGSQHKQMYNVAF